MASSVYNKGMKVLADSGDADSVDFANDTIVVLLMQSAYVFDKTNEYISELTSEVAVAGYSRQTLAGKTVTLDNTNDRCVYDGTDPVFSGMSPGQTVRAAVLAKNTGADATSPLLFYVQFSADVALVAATTEITVNFNTNGISYTQRI